MALYAIGDIQGCHEALLRLLERLRFDPAADRLWFAGDLVNRGPASLDTLRFVRSLGERAATVLGNHDLHLLAVAHGGRHGRRDTLDEVLAAPDRDELIDWLRRRPLMVESQDGGTAMIHAGLPPQWDLAQARLCARETEAALRDEAGHAELLRRMYGDEPDHWDERLEGWPRLRFSINCFTRLRYCDAQGRLAPRPKGAPGSQPPGLLPWFAVPGRRSAGTRLIFGHWSTLGRVHWPEHEVWGLDSGCVWGGRLSALCLDDGQLTDVACSACHQPDAGED